MAPAVLPVSAVPLVSAVLMALAVLAVSAVLPALTGRDDRTFGGALALGGTASARRLAPAAPRHSRQTRRPGCV